MSWLHEPKNQWLKWDSDGLFLYWDYEEYSEDAKDLIRFGIIQNASDWKDASLPSNWIAS